MRDYEEGDLVGQIFPSKPEGEMGGTLEVVYDTTYSGYFADADGDVLKRIVKYGEPAKATSISCMGRKIPSRITNTGLKTGDGKMRRLKVR